MVSVNWNISQSTNTVQIRVSGPPCFVLGYFGFGFVFSDSCGKGLILCKEFSSVHVFREIQTAVHQGEGSCFDLMCTH